MMAHLKAHRQRREQERQSAELARRDAAYKLIIRAFHDADAMTDSEWDQIDYVLGLLTNSPEFLEEKLQRAAICERAIASVPELLPRKRASLLKPHAIGADDVVKEWSEVVSRHSELESISMSLPMLVPRPRPLPDPLSV